MEWLLCCFETSKLYIKKKVLKIYKCNKSKYIRRSKYSKKLNTLEDPSKTIKGFLTKRWGNIEVRLLDNWSSACEGGSSLSTPAIPSFTGSPKVIKEKRNMEWLIDPVRWTLTTYRHQPACISKKKKINSGINCPETCAILQLG